MEMLPTPRCGMVFWADRQPPRRRKDELKRRTRMGRNAAMVISRRGF
jgi:hypothetical protein